MNLGFQGTNAIEGIFLNTSAAEPIEFTTEAFKMMNLDYSKFVEIINVVLW